MMKQRNAEKKEVANSDLTLLIICWCLDVTLHGHLEMGSPENTLKSEPSWAPHSSCAFSNATLESLIFLFAIVRACTRG